MAVPLATPAPLVLTPQQQAVRVPLQAGLGKLRRADPRTSARSHHRSAAGGRRAQLSAFSAPPLLAELINRWNHTLGE